MRKIDFMLAITTLLMANTFAQSFEDSIRPSEWEKRILKETPPFTDNNDDIRCMNLFTSKIVNYINVIEFPPLETSYHSMYPVKVSFIWKHYLLNFTLLFDFMLLNFRSIHWHSLDDFTKQTHLWSTCWKLNICNWSTTAWRIANYGHLSKITKKTWKHCGILTKCINSIFKL